MLILQCSSFDELRLIHSLLAARGGCDSYSNTLCGGRSSCTFREERCQVWIRTWTSSQTQGSGLSWPTAAGIDRKSASYRVPISQTRASDCGPRTGTGTRPAKNLQWTHTHTHTHTHTAHSAHTLGAQLHTCYRCSVVVQLNWCTAPQAEPAAAVERQTPPSVCHILSGPVILALSCSVRADIFCHGSVIFCQLSYSVRTLSYSGRALSYSVRALSGSLRCRQPPV